MEYCKAKWLERAGNRIKRTVKVDRTILMASCGKFARVCMEMDLTKPLMVGYRLKGEIHDLQFEGLHDLCFHCSRYRHRLSSCPMKVQQSSPSKDDKQNEERNKSKTVEEQVH